MIELPDPLERRRRLLEKLNPDPAMASALAKCTAFYQNSATSGAISSVVDVKGGAALAQSSANFKPTGAAGGEISFDGDGATGDFLLATLSNAVNNGSPRWGFATFLKPSSVTSLHGIWGCATVAGASAGRLEIVQNGTSVLWDVYAAAFSIRRGTYANAFALNTRALFTAEYDGTQSTDATKAIVTSGLTQLTGVFTNDTGTPNAMPATLIQPTGTATIGERRSTSTLNPYAGLMGPWIAIAQPSSSLTGGGIWTAAERVALNRLLRAA